MGGKLQEHILHLGEITDVYVLNVALNFLCQFLLLKV